MTSPATHIAKERILEINLLRAVAILMVVLLHSTSLPLNRVGKDSSSFIFYVFVNNLSNFAVPLFILISGMVLFYTYYDKPVTRRAVGTFYKKRMLSVILPYFVFTVFYFLLNNYNVPEYMNIRRFTYLFFTGRAHTHLYYMFVIIQLYLIFPLLWALVRKIKLNLLWIGFAMQIGYVFLNREWVIYQDWLPAIFHRTASLSITYFGIFIFGGFLGIYYPRIKQWFHSDRLSIKGKLCWIGITGLWLINGLYYSYLVYSNKVSDKQVGSLQLYWHWLAHAILAALVLFMVSSVLIRRASNGKLLKLILNLGSCAFGIYLIHPFIMWLYRLIPYGGQPLYFHLYIIGYFASALLISWGITAFLITRFPWSWLLFGTSPHQAGSKGNSVMRNQKGGLSG